MKKLYIISIFSLGMSSHVFAGNGSQGGPPPLSDRLIIETPISEISIPGNVEDRLELEVTPNEMLWAIDAALKQKELPFKLNNGQTIKITPETMDFSRREMTAKIKDLSGTRVLLREISAE